LVVVFIIRAERLQLDHRNEVVAMVVKVVVGWLLRAELDQDYPYSQQCLTHDME
jgi:hypothetical protein